MISDASCALTELRARFPGVPTVVGGICSGGNVALGLAASRPREVDAVVALSPLPFQPARGAKFERRRRWRNIKQYAAKALRVGTWVRLLRGEVNLERVGKNVTAREKPAGGERNLKDSARDIEKELLVWRGRLLCVWGAGDEEGPAARRHFEALFAGDRGSAAVFAVVPGANHNFYGQAWRDELAERLRRFLGEPDSLRPG
jgi:pimeloyl-ACP methyl ester carboxylesterase